MKGYLLLGLGAILIVLGASCDGSSNEAENHYNAGVELQEQGRAEDAIAEYDQAILLDPRYAVAYINRAVVYTILGKDAEAEKNIGRAVQLGIDLAVLRQTNEIIEELKRER